MTLPVVSGIDVLLSARRSLHSLPAAVLGPDAQQRRCMHHPPVFRRRLTYFFGGDFSGDLPELLMILMRALCLPAAPCVRMGSLTFVLCATVGSDGPQVHGAQRCLRGCSVVGGDEVRHYCPAVLAAIALQAARPPAWAHYGHDPCACSCW